MAPESLKAKKICVLMGGRSSERDVSLRSGRRVLESLKRQGFDVISLDLEDNLLSRLKAARVDIVYIVLHGRYGEDGAAQGMLEIAGIPYTGSKVLASALAMNKVAAKKIFNAVGITTPRYLTIEPRQKVKNEADKIIKDFSFPLVLKPVSEGSSLGVHLIKEPGELLPKLEETVQKYHEMFVEEFIKGQEVTAGVIGVGDDLQALPILELVPKKEFYDFEAKYTAGMTEFILPARLSPALTAKVQALAIRAHQALGCHGVSRVDMIIKDEVPYVHEVNTIPGMTEQSDLPAEAREAGISFDDLVVKILASAY
ncbi:D-alanine--D-alanine ligase [Candidatus Saganbacteria bacterium]|nr:D-alanine--D-alanine ligase [Candidatus Saganbacteria bacterium]